MSLKFDAGFVPAETFGEAADRIAALTGARLPMTRGPKRALLALRDALGLQIDAVATNAELGAALAAELSIEWIPSQFVDRTKLTLDGVNALLYGASIAYEEGALKSVASAVPRGLAGPEWSDFQPAMSKIEAVTRIASLTNSPPESLGPGSKERKSVLTNLANRLFPDLDPRSLSKTRLAAELARRLGVPWGDEYISTGETIQLSGLNVILAGAERRLGRLGDGYAHGLAPDREAGALVDALWQKLLRSKETVWDGIEKTLWLRDQGTGQEMQMEWPGFYFEYRGKQILDTAFRPNPTPPQRKFGNTVFDYALNHVWDLKSHTAEKYFPVSGRISRPRKAVQLNDMAAVRECVAKQGLGFLILDGRGEMDEDGAFKAWHDAFKGRAPRPSLSGNSRLRKARFAPLAVEAYWIPDLPTLDAAIARGVVRVNRQGRQQDGSPRAPKFLMSLGPARTTLLVARRAW